VAQKHAEGEARARAMRERMEENFRQWRSGEEVRLEKEVAEARAKEEKAEEEKKERARRLQASIDESRAAQARRRVEEREEGLRADKANADKWGAVVFDLERREYEEQQYRRREARRTVEENMRIAIDKAKRISEAEKRRSSADVEAAREALLGDDVFQERAKRLVDEERAKGHQTLPLERAIRRTQKEPMIAANAIF
jgi:hypothetical protein